MSVISFNDFINESSSSGPESSQYATDIIKHVKQLDASDGSYDDSGKLEYRGLDTFDLVIQIKKEESPNFQKDEHFAQLQWEELNFENYGFALDANTYIDNETIPEIIVTLIIDPSREPDLYEELNFKLIDIIAHELNHTNQIGWNREPFNTDVSSKEERTAAKQNAGYFLLPDEVESMVLGMYERSKAEGVNLDELFDKYLFPFIEHGTITKEEYMKIFEIWIIHALENFPDAELSDAQNVQKIVKSI